MGFIEEDLHLVEERERESSIMNLFIIFGFSFFSSPPPHRSVVCQWCQSSHDDDDVNTNERE